MHFGEIFTTGNIQNKKVVIMEGKDFQRMFIVPENILNNLQDIESNSKHIPGDIFDSDIDTKRMETLKNNLVSVLNSSKLDQATIKRYKSDLAKLMDLEGPAVIGNVGVSDHHIKDKMIKKDDGNVLEDVTFDGSDTAFYTGSESDFLGDLSEGDVSTPHQKSSSDLDETMKNQSSTNDPPTTKNVKKRLFQEVESDDLILDRDSLKNEKKTIVKNALKIEDFILKNAEGRIRRDSLSSFTIDGKRIKGELYCGKAV